MRFLSFFVLQILEATNPIYEIIFYSYSLLQKKNYLDFNQDGQQTFWVVLHPLTVPCLVSSETNACTSVCVCVSGDSYGRVEELSLLPDALSNDNSHLSLLCVCVCMYMCVFVCGGGVCVWVGVCFLFCSLDES